MRGPIEVSIPKQIPGCLPRGYTLDSLLTVAQFCAWRQVSASWFRARRKKLPGVIRESRETVVIHPRTYLDKRLTTT